MPTSSLVYSTYSSISTTNTIQSTPPSSTGAVLVTPTESLRPSPTRETSRTPDPRPHSTSITTAAVLASISVVIAGAALIVVIAIVIYRKPSRRHLGRNDSMISNAVYGTTPVRIPENMAATSRRGDTYDYPRFGLRLLKSIRGKKSSAVHNNTTTVAVSEGDEPGNEYTMDFSSNETYGTSLSSTEDDFEYSYVRYL